MKLSEEVVASLKPGENLIAGYCHNRVGNGLLDFGLLVELDGYRSFHQTAQQTSVDVQPMQTYYTFTCGPVDLKLTFTAPMFMDNLDLLSRPVNYISYEVASMTERNIRLSCISKHLRNGQSTNLTRNLLPTALLTAICYSFVPEAAIRIF